MKYQVQENCLTIFLPHELDHHNAEEIRRESDHLIIRNHIRYIIFVLRRQILWTVRGLDDHGTYQTDLYAGRRNLCSPRK